MDRDEKFGLAWAILIMTVFVGAITYGALGRYKLEAELREYAIAHPKDQALINDYLAAIKESRYIIPIDGDVELQRGLVRKHGYDAAYRLSNISNELN